MRLVDVDLRAAVEALAPFLDRPVVFGTVTAGRVTLETPHPVPRTDVLRLTRGLVESQNLELATDTAAGIYRIKAHDVPAPTPAPVTSSGGPGPSDRGGLPALFVIRLRHARATDVAATVNALYGRASALGEPGTGGPANGSSSGFPPTLGHQLAQNQLSPAGVPSPVPPQAVGSVAGRAATLSGETTIVPDPGTNSLLIRANQSDFDLIAAAVAQLDIRPLQVLIEVVIAEVSKNSSFALGLGDSVAPVKLDHTGNTTIGGSVAGLGLGDFVLQVMREKNPGFTATLAAAAQKGEARILSRPIVLASNNQPAEILVGSQQPFIQVSQTQVGAVAQNQVVQYQDVGTKLTVRPTISSDGYVALDVSQEVSQATGEVTFNAPVISTRTVKTQLLVKNGQTIVLGGLSSKEKDKNRTGIPVLSSIPLIGGLFGRTNRTTTESEFFLFLTPRIVDSDAAADTVTAPLRKRAAAGQP